jgi:hypothetical protein
VLCLGLTVHGFCCMWTPRALSPRNMLLLSSNFLRCGPARLAGTVPVSWLWERSKQVKFKPAEKSYCLLETCMLYLVQSQDVHTQESFVQCWSGSKMRSAVHNWPCLQTVMAMLCITAVQIVATPAAGIYRCTPTAHPCPQAADLSSQVLTSAAGTLAGCLPLCSTPHASTLQHQQSKLNCQPVRTGTILQTQHDVRSGTPSSHAAAVHTLT